MLGLSEDSGKKGKGKKIKVKVEIEKNLIYKNRNITKLNLLKKTNPSGKIHNIILSRIPRNCTQGAQPSTGILTGNAMGSCCFV